MAEIEMLQGFVGLGAIIAAIIGAGTSIGTTAYSRRASGRAANLQAGASTEAARLQAASSREQLDYTRGQSRWARQAAEIAQQNNYQQWLSGQQNLERQGWDTSVNTRGVQAADRRNAYAQATAQGRNLYGQRALQERRLGRLGELTGAPPREIAGRTEAGYVPMAPLQRSEQFYPEYVSTPFDIPPDPQAEAQEQARLASTRDAVRQGLSQAQYIQQQALAPYGGMV
jgi:hypothetical protein